MAPSIVSNTSKNKKELNKLYNEYLNEFREFNNAYPFKVEYNFPAPDNPERVTKFDIENAKNALSNLRQEKEEADEEPVDDALEMINNLRNELRQGDNTEICELMEAILDTTIADDYDGLVGRLYNLEDYMLELASIVAFDSNPSRILQAAERLAELISGSRQYNQQISDVLQVWKKGESKVHSASSSKARNDEY